MNYFFTAAKRLNVFVLVQQRASTAPNTSRQPPREILGIVMAENHRTHLIFLNPQNPEILPEVNSRYCCFLFFFFSSRTGAADNVKVINIGPYP